MRYICELTAMQAEFKVESIKQADFKIKKTVYTIPFTITSLMFISFMMNNDRYV